MIEPGLYNTSQRDGNKRLSFARLYAEVIGGMGNPGLALMKLKEVLNTVSMKAITPIVLSQARNTEVWLLTKLSHYKEARELGEALLAESVRRDDKLGAAIALTNTAIVHQLSGYPKLAYENLHNAVDLFRECGVSRGLAWSLSYLARTYIKMSDIETAIKCLKESLKIYADIGECSLDYLELLKELKQKLPNQYSFQALNGEIRRVSAVLNDLKPVT